MLSVEPNDLENPKHKESDYSTFLERFELECRKFSE